MTARKLMRIPQALEYLNGTVKEKTLRDWIWKRRIESVRIGRSVCVPVDALDRMIERGTTPVLDR